MSERDHTAAPAVRHEHFVARRSARCAVRGPTDLARVRELWLVLHGYGQLAAEFVAQFAPIDDGTRLFVAPEALSRFYDTRTSPEAHREATIGASWMTREERLHEIADYVAWLQVAYEGFASQLPPDIPVTVLGFSQGATAASRWVASGGVSAARLICWGASIGPELDLGATSPLRRQPLYIVIGGRDKFIGAAQVDAERARLDAAGLPHTIMSFDGGHRLDDALLARFAAGTP